MKEEFTRQRFSGGSLALIEKANSIIDEYTQTGFILTLRQLYYQMVARGVLENKVQSYKRLGSILNDARYAGLVDWGALEDRTRNLKGLSHWDSPSDIIESAAASYRIDKWADQDYRPEVWVEKEALAGIVERASVEQDVSYLSCRGYLSASEMYEAAQRIRRRSRRGQGSVVIYLGDHDPSGLDMSDGDIPKRFNLFLDNYGLPMVEVRRIALNWDQIQEFNPPPNPAKETDSRFEEYQKRFGDESWELDALDPNTLLNLITETIWEYRNLDKYEAAEEREAKEKAVLTATADRWPEVEKFLSKKGRSR